MLQTAFLLVLISSAACINIRSSATGSNRITIAASVKEEEPRGTVFANLRKSLEEKLTGHQQIAGDGQFAVIGEQKCSRYFNVTRNGMVAIAQKIDREALCSEVQACCAQEHASYADNSSPTRDNLASVSNMHSESNQCKLELEVTAHVSQQPIRFNLAVTIVDENDNAPFWPQNTYVLHVREGPKSGYLRHPFPAAIDLDEPRNAVRSYRIVQQVPFERDPTFSVTYEGGSADRLKPCLQQNLPLDRETREWYNLTIEASDGRNLSGRLHLFVSVTDVNDNAPRLERSFYNVSVAENIDTQELIVTVRANDSDAAANGQVRYAISEYSPSNSDMMRIEPATGRVFLNGVKLDYETHKTHCLIVVAYDSGTPPLSATATVQINVLDINDEVPRLHVFNGNLQSHLSVHENQPIGTKIGFLQVSDADTPKRLVNCESRTDDFRLSSNNDGIFDIKTNRVFDREEQPTVSVHIVCRDGADNSANHAAITENVEIVDVNDNAPAFLHAVNGTLIVNVYEGNTPNTRVLNATAIDLDSGDNGIVAYRLIETGVPFRVANRTGEIFAQSILDRERNNEYRFALVAFDHGVPPRSATVTVVARVLDVNDHAPDFSQNVYHFSVDENEKPGVFVGQIYATDRDEQPENGAIDFFVNKSVEQDFDVRQNGKIYTARSFDRETMPSYNITVYATDRGHPARTSAAQVKITINDENDNRPRFYWQPNSTVHISYRNSKPGAVARLTAEDPDHDKNGHIEYILRGDSGGVNFLTIDPFTGDLRLIRALSAADVGFYMLLVEARDGGQPSKSESISVAVNVVETVYADASRAHAPLWDILSSDSNRVTSLIIFLSIISMTLALILIATFVIIIRCRMRNARDRFNPAGRQNDKVTTQRPIPDVRSNNSRCGNKSRSNDDLHVNYAPIVDYTHGKPVNEDVSESDAVNYLDDVDPRYSSLFNAPTRDFKETLPAFNQNKFCSMSIHTYEGSPIATPKVNGRYAEAGPSSMTSSMTFRRKADQVCGAAPISNDCTLRKVNLSVCRNMLERSTLDGDNTEALTPLSSTQTDQEANAKPEDSARLAPVHIESQAFLPSV